MSFSVTLDLNFLSQGLPLNPELSDMTLLVGQSVCPGDSSDAACPGRGLQVHTAKHDFKQKRNMDSED